jgi:hypothetical protein
VYTQKRKRKKREKRKKKEFLFTRPDTESLIKQKCSVPQEKKRRDRALRALIERRIRTMAEEE